MPMQPPDGRKVKSVPVGAVEAADRHERARPSKHAVKSSIMPLASRRLEQETAGTFVNQQLDPPSCVNLEEQYFCHRPSESTAMTDAARAFGSASV
jgi:hypothetical protein